MDVYASLAALMCATAGLTLQWFGEWKLALIAWILGFLIQTLRILAMRGRR